MKTKLIALLLFTVAHCSAQLSTDDYRKNLSKLVSLNVNQERLDNVLQILSQTGGFYFSYNGALVKQDSLVDLRAKNIPVREVLDRLFNGDMDYKENSEYIILRYAVNHLTIESPLLDYGNNEYTVSGYVIDTKSGNYVKQASVYEKKLLQGTLTDQSGYFSMRFKGEYKGLIITASKDTYRDTSLIFLADVRVSPSAYDDPEKEKGAFFSKTFKNRGIWRFLLSKRQKSQNSNLPNFLAKTPFQASLVPGISSHRGLSSNIVNKVSLNIIGGYTAGTNGVEVAGAFNLTKGNIKNVQAAGAFNVVGGSVIGFQTSGLYNDVNENLKGVQLGGALNRLEGDLNGVQVAGAINIIGNNLKGAQIAGVVNWSNNTEGVQISGLINKTSNQLKGAQISGAINYAKKMDGFQIGIINLADTSSGVSLGLINFSRNGYFTFKAYSSETIHNNIALKTGNKKLYTLLIAGSNFSANAKVFTYGIGLGHDFKIGKNLTIGTEGTAQFVYLGDNENVNNLYRIHTNLQYAFFKQFTAFAGPAYNYYVKHVPQAAIGKNYQKVLAPKWHHEFNNGAQGWFGWNFGLSFNVN